MSIILLGLFLKPGLGFTTPEKTDVQYWQESGIVIDDTHYRSVDCYANSLEFRACLARLNVLASYLEPSVRIIPKALYRDKDVKQGAQTGFVGMGTVVVKIPEADDKDKNYSLRSVVEAIKTEHKKLAKEEEVLYHQIMQDLRRNFTQSKMYIGFEEIASLMREDIKNNPKHKAKLAKIAGKSINAGLAVMDAHTYILPTKFLNDQDVLADQIFFGIGAQLQMLKGRPVITSLTDGGQAKKSKLLKANDILLQVDGHSIKNLELIEIINLIRGPENTKVHLLIERNGEEKSIEVPRGKIEVKNVEYKVVKDIGFKSMGYIKLNSFSDSYSCQKIADALKELQASEVTKIILDFRDNLGGLVNQALCIGGLFVGDKPIIGVKDINASEKAPIRFRNSYSLEDMILSNSLKNQRVLGIRPAERKSKLPVVILINAASASASEVVSGALQDHKEAWIVGETSFGKATMQSVRPLQVKNRDLSMGKTKERFYQPSGRTNQVVGIQPDFTVPFKPNATEDERFAMREGDVFPGALPPLGAEWTPNRPEDIARITSCMNKNKRALEIYEKMKLDQDNEDRLDYQLLSAQEILICDEETAVKK